MSFVSNISTNAWEDPLRPCGSLYPFRSCLFLYPFLCPSHPFHLSPSILDMLHLPQLQDLAAFQTEQRPSNWDNWLHSESMRRGLTLQKVWTQECPATKQCQSFLVQILNSSTCRDVVTISLNEFKHLKAFPEIFPPRRLFLSAKAGSLSPGLDKYSDPCLRVFESLIGFSISSAVSGEGTRT